MKNILALFVIFLVAFGCKNDDINPNPIISDLEIGSNNSKVVKQGEDLHIEAEIFAEDLIEIVEIEIHKEDGKGWEFHKEITKLSGQKNGELHEHFEIPSDAALGQYHLHIKVKDKKGKVTIAETEIEIIA